MHSNPLVSVIVPCYNYGKFLEEALKSLLAQTYSNWECIIVDDGSVDNTREAAGQFVAADPRFRYIYQENAGLAGARNTALNLARGEYIQLLDADDMLEDQKLSLQLALFRDNKHIDLIFSDILSFSDSESPRRYKPLVMEAQPRSGKGEDLIDGLIIDNFFLPGCAIFSRELYNRVGHFRSGMSGLEDWNYWFRAALLGAGFYHDKREGTRLLARNHGENMSSHRRGMLISKIKARKDVMNFTNYLLKEGKLNWSVSFQRRLNRLHRALLNRDGARLNLFYGNFVAGCVQMIKHAFYSGKPYFAFYDGAYWIKERIKKNSVS